MNRLDHRISGSVAGATYAAALNLTPAQTIACMWLSTITSAGKTSPDIDQYPQWTGNKKDIPQWWWVPVLRRVLLAIGPNNRGDPVAHRRFTHWPGIPAVLGALLWWGEAQTPEPTSIASGGVVVFLVVAAVHFAFIGAGALVAGWASHDLTDWPFGQRNRGRGSGIPWMPWWGHAGANLKSNGWLAHGAVWLIIVPGGLATFLRFDVVEMTARTCFGG